MSRNDVALEIFYDGAWHDLVAGADVLAEQPLVVQRGDGAESAAPRPASLAARLKNDDDTYRTSNPESPLYGKAGRNTPVRVSVGGTVRGYVQASRWESAESRDFRRTPKRGKAWVDVEAGGVLQQIGQWKEPLKSAVVRQTLAQTGLIGFWPLDDASDATRLSTPLPGGNAGTFSGDVTLGQELNPGGSPATALRGSGGLFTGRFLTSSASGWRVTFGVHVTATLTAGFQEIFRWTDTRGRTWAWEINDTDMAWRIYDADGTTLTYQSAGRGGFSMNRWVRCTIKVSVSGGTISFEPFWFGPDGDNAGITLTFAGTSTGQPHTWRTPDTTYSTGASYSAVYGLSNADDEAADPVSAFYGFAGEQAAWRFARLLNEHGLGYVHVGDPELSEPMGPQQPDTLTNLLQECRDTEDALMYDARTSLNVVFHTRIARYNQTAVSIDVSELPARPPEVIDDLGVANIVTVAQRNGGEAVARDDTGPVGTQAPPDGFGPYEQTVNVNVEDETTLPDLAGWWLNRFTVELPRYPQVTVNLAALDAARVAQIEAIDVGDVIEITGYRENAIRLHVIGYREVIGWPRARTITFVTVPDRQFVVGVYDAATSRYDLSTCTLSAAAGPAATTLSLAITADEAWSQTSAFELYVAGELIGVPAGGMGARGGSAGAYTQTLTGAIRSRNGIRKTLPAGSPVHVATPGRWAR